MAEEDATLNLRLSDDKQSMQINIVRGERREAGVILTADLLDRIIGGLAHIRSQMIPPVLAKLKIGDITHRHEFVPYVVGVDPTAQKPALSFRSPGLGWLSFVLLAVDAENIRSGLQEAVRQTSRKNIQN